MSDVEIMVVQAAEIERLKVEIDGLVSIGRDRRSVPCAICEGLRIALRETREALEINARCLHDRESDVGKITYAVLARHAPLAGEAPNAG